MSNPALYFHWRSNLSCFTVRNLGSKVIWNCGDTDPVVRSNISPTLLTWFGKRLRYIPPFDLYSYLLYIPIPHCNFSSKTYDGHPKGIQMLVFVWTSTLLNICRGDRSSELWRFGESIMSFFAILREYGHRLMMIVIYHLLGWCISIALVISRKDCIR